ncbi:hypothetical protein JF50_20300 [Pseudoalteromonas luteoviolacea]|uniref:Uncharacterized protein n=1 Tax=Pseudoalteromonas luteoviolacea TaxID=43657 RepID=A0A0C1Q7R4_9GAMM|nr:hypothetical protein JF50_20300 [Pseudoalteromonas luteoviolacea]
MQSITANKVKKKQTLKLAHLIFATVIALTDFYIQIGNPDKVIYLYIATLAFFFAYGIYKSKPNI